MPKFYKHTDIKAIIKADQGNTSDEHVIEVAHKTAKVLRDNLAGDIDDDWDLEEIVDSLENIEEYHEDVLLVLNRLLSELYDWADANRVWLGI